MGYDAARYWGSYLVTPFEEHGGDFFAPATNEWCYSPMANHAQSDRVHLQHTVALVAAHLFFFLNLFSDLTPAETLTSQEMGYYFQINCEKSTNDFRNLRVWTAGGLIRSKLEEVELDCCDRSKNRSKGKEEPSLGSTGASEQGEGLPSKLKYDAEFRAVIKEVNTCRQIGGIRLIDEGKQNRVNGGQKALPVRYKQQRLSVKSRSEKSTCIKLVKNKTHNCQNTWFNESGSDFKLRMELDCDQIPRTLPNCASALALNTEYPRRRFILRPRIEEGAHRFCPGTAANPSLNRVRRERRLVTRSYIGISNQRESKRSTRAGSLSLGSNKFGGRLQVRSEDAGEEEDEEVKPEPHLEFEQDGNLEYGQPQPLASDPHEDKLNQRLEANGIEIWDENPCRYYNAYSNSHPNKRRMRRCKEAVDILHDAGFKDGDSSLCPTIQGADCFQFKDHVQSGRCYAQVTDNNAHRYVLLNNCVRDWMRAKNISGTSWPTAAFNDSLPGTPEPPPEESDMFQNGDPAYRQPEERPDDPPDEVMNRKLVVNGHVIWYENPCKKYSMGSYSQDNHNANIGCQHALQHMYDAGFFNSADPKSKLCPQIDDANCFMFRDNEKDSRCYAKVQKKGGLQYILLYSCIRDWQKFDNLTHPPELYPEGDGYYAQPEVKPTDMPDEQMDRTLIVQHTRIWNSNPCQYYGHTEKPSFPEEDDVAHRDDCRSAVRFLKDAGFVDGESKLCPKIDGADCFQFKDSIKSGRCYAKVTSRNGRKYVLVVECVRDWLRSRNISENTVWPITPEEAKPLPPRTFSEPL